MTDEHLSLDNLRMIRDNAVQITKSPGFLEWRDQLDGQIELRKLQALRPASEVKDPEYEKGYVCGMMHALKGWELLIEQFNEAIKDKQENDEDA